MITEPIILDWTDEPIAAGSTPMISGQFVDALGDSIPLIALDSFTLSIVNKVSGAPINSVLDVSILNEDRGTVNADGSFQIQLQTTDTTIDPTKAYEYRSAILTWMWNGALVGKRQYDLVIDALASS